MKYSTDDVYNAMREVVQWFKEDDGLVDPGAIDKLEDIVSEYDRVMGEFND